MQSSDTSRAFSWLRLLARSTAGLSRFAVVGLVALAAIAAIPLVGATADWLVTQREGGQSGQGGVRSFLAKDTPTAPPSCMGQACGLATLPLATYQQAGGANSAAVAALIRWPAPQVIEASAGAYLEMVGVSDSASPNIERRRNRDEDSVNLETDARPLLLANEVPGGGSKRPIMVGGEGFVSAWTDESAAPLGAPTLWAPNPTPGRNDHTQEAAIERRRQWQALRVRSLQYQTVPNAWDLDVPRSPVASQIAVGDVMVFDWEGSGVLDGRFQQVAPMRSMLGVVINVQAIGEYARVSVQVPRGSPYSGGAHWLGQRLRLLPVGATPLPNQVNAVFFKPTAILGATPDWNQMERMFQKLPFADMLRAPVAALDASCAEPAVPSDSCVWVRLHGVAVPVQVRTQALEGGYVSLTERAVFAGKAVRSADWAALPREFRREFAAPSGVGTEVTRKLLSRNTQSLLAPQAWLTPGLPVSTAAAPAGAKP